MSGIGDRLGEVVTYTNQPTGGLFWEEVVSHLLFGREFITCSF